MQLKNSNRIKIVTILSLIAIALSLSGILGISNINIISINDGNISITNLMNPILKNAAPNDDPQGDFLFSEDRSPVPPGMQPDPMFDLKGGKYYPNGTINLYVYGTIDETNGNLTSGNGWFYLDMYDAITNLYYMPRIGIASDNKIRANLTRINMDTYQYWIWNGTDWVGQGDPIDEVEADLCISDPNGTKSIRMNISGITGVNYNNIKVVCAFSNILLKNGLPPWKSIFDDYIIKYDVGIDPLLLLLLS
jgi:hypothetical protein